MPLQTDDLEAAIRERDPSVIEGEVKERQHAGERYPSQWTVEISGPRSEAIKEIHESRSERAQDTDERQNAPVTTDEEKWIENKNRLDYPGVDTIPEERLAARAEAAAGWALEEGILNRVEHKGSGSRLQGKFSPPEAKTYGKGESVVRVQREAGTPSKTLAHELGHAIDYAFDEDADYGLSEFLFSSDDFYEGEYMDLEPDERRAVAKKSNQLKREAERVSQQSRGGVQSRGKKYRTSDIELTADVLGQGILQPRATRREAPLLFGRLEEAAERGGFESVFPEPLGRDPERRGILSLD